MTDDPTTTPALSAEQAARIAQDDAEVLALTAPHRGAVEIERDPATGLISTIAERPTTKGTDRG